MDGKRPRPSPVGWGMGRTRPTFPAGDRWTLAPFDDLNDMLTLHDERIRGATRFSPMLGEMEDNDFMASIDWRA